MKIVNKNYNIKGSINTNIVLISDIHYYKKKDIIHLNKILDNIKKLKPDFICIPGDLTDESNICDEDYLLEWLTKLTHFSKVILTLGNHELYINRRKDLYGLNNKLVNKIKKINNLYLLGNESKVIDNINFIGVTLNIDEYHNEEKHIINFNKYNLNNKYYNIVLCHTPISITNETNLKNIDLVLCGHMHGGIVPRFLRKIFKNNGLISPSKRLFPKNVYGKILKDNSTIIITSGITVVSHLNSFRFLKNFFASEIVEIKIKDN